MIIRQRMVAALTSAMLLVASIIGSASAYDAKVSIAPGGTLSASITRISLPEQSFSLTSQTLSNGNIFLTASDLTGNYAGWKVTFQVPNFTGAGVPFIPSSNLILRTHPNPVTTVSGQGWLGTVPQGSWQAAIPVSTLSWTGAPTVFTANGGVPATGSTGQYAFTLPIRLNIPAGQPAGVYTSDITVTMMAGN